ncbi:hypothetical protein Tco_0555983 [Tanacetum coccineum]
MMVQYREDMSIDQSQAMMIHMRRRLGGLYWIVGCYYCTRGECMDDVVKFGEHKVGIWTYADYTVELIAWSLIFGVGIDKDYVGRGVMTIGSRVKIGVGIRMSPFSWVMDEMFWGWYF